jgi:type II secretory ATPase GspE/PulE/Tfp pilus assembly ATPase PilB-like protein
MLGLDSVGLTPENRALIDQALRQPTGVILCSGPTGSGKTTVLYSMLMQVVEPSKQVFTVEEPVEYLLPGVVQIQVNRNAGVTAAMALRSLRRNDPDVIMVGEIRDLETMELAIQAALTGHLVLSQSHTNDAPSALMRMIDIGVEPFLLTSTMVAATNQRLVRMVCGDCKRPNTPSQAMLEEMRRMSAAGGYTVPAAAEFVTGDGCPRCRETGHCGRTGIFEVLLATPALMERVERGAPVEELRDAAIRGGMTTLVADGVRKAVEGVTTLEEVARVTVSSPYR